MDRSVKFDRRRRVRGKRIDVRQAAANGVRDLRGGGEHQSDEQKRRG